jgi:O-antigen/teichoic acid export membrane protein
LSEIRTTYSGLISLIVTFISLFTSLGFSVIVTRNLSQTDFGMWGVLGSLIIYGMFFDSFIGYWTTRETARNEKSQKTALIFNQTLSSAGSIIFVISIFLVGVIKEIDYDILFLIILLIPLKYLLKILNTINFGWKPQNSSYGQIISEILKITVGIILIFYFQMGLIGLILSLIISSSGNIIIQFILTKEKLKHKIEIRYIRKWIKNLFVPLYGRLSTIVFESDKLIVVLLMDSVISVSYFMAAMIVASIVLSSSSLSSVVYGKLLSGSKDKFLTNTLTLQFFVSIPLVSLSIIFAELGMQILNPIYEIASIVVIVLVMRGFFQSFKASFLYYIMGSEDVDKSSTNFREYLKSSLVTLSHLDLIQTTMYLVTLYTVLSILGNKISDVDIAFYWSIILLTFTIPFTIYYWKLAKNKVHFNLEIKRIFKFGIISLIVFSFTYFLIPDQILSSSPFEIIFNILPLILLGLGGYLGISLIVDNKIRSVLYLIIKEIKK